MRIVRYEHAGDIGIGTMGDGCVTPTGCASIVEAMARGLGPRGEPLPLSRVRLLAPLPAPSKILCSGLNYRSHLEENPGAVLPTYPQFFAKLPSAVIGPGDAIVIPAPGTQVDYEVELAVVIGKTARGVKAADAYDYIYGYTVVNDVSARDVQFRDNQITTGKGFDTFCPMGPAVARRDEIPDPGALRLANYVNGERRQDGTTADMLVDVPTLLQFISARITLHPGDVVSTGTPAGVGAFRRPPAYLRPGDEVAVEVEGIGRLVNPVVAA